ncbi:rubrerythrin family protein [Candidatus Berkelbacteria bacterium CG10_big_fil_rev_8_21_14_0_10_41_12]|uniref:Rubrerythrin family protein n=1 Tax=Candidatus Berkelbacteria bacterium CG10_big_fil_rev_8_21_14_0_10_41_12 TaxID=1974513 RepID=A0A2M6WXG0_9BACT|nr:MAG: rubrerythrin family protein [Candidatus Berkelbacteria bacterium CG10_big_fil_rev_8_21_14_0_10_41_12]
MANKTDENLLKAFTGESIARNKYTLFASVARKEGFEGIARIFEITANNERGHAEILMEFIKPGTKTTFNSAIEPVADTYTNLVHAAEGEKYEWGTMYPDFEKIAREEGEDEIAGMFKEIAEVEEKHEERYRKLADDVKGKTVFKRDEEIEWECLNCGYIHKGKEAPEKCPACAHPQAFYKPRCALI